MNNTFDNISNSEYFKDLSSIISNSNNAVSSNNQDQGINNETNRVINDQLNESSTVDELKVSTSTSSLSELVSSIKSENEFNNVSKTTATIFDKEDQNQGAVTYHTYQEYLLASNANRKHASINIILLILLFICTEAARLYTNYWFATWTGKEEQYYENPLTTTKVNSTYYIKGFGFSYLFTILITLSILIFSYHILLAASRNLHDKMLYSISRAKILFFQSNPLGRILNRFSSDIGIMDDEIPPTGY